MKSLASRSGAFTVTWATKSTYLGLDVSFQGVCKKWHEKSKLHGQDPRAEGKSLSYSLHPASPQLCGPTPSQHPLRAWHSTEHKDEPVLIHAVMDPISQGFRGCGIRERDTMACLPLCRRVMCCSIRLHPHGPSMTPSHAVRHQDCHLFQNDTTPGFILLNILLAQAGCFAFLKGFPHFSNSRGQKTISNPIPASS